MSEFPSGNNNGRSIGWRAKTAAKSAQLLVADMAGNIAELIFLRYQGAMNNALPWVRDGFKSVMYTPMKMMQKQLERALEEGSNFEDKAHHDQRVGQSEEKRLDGLLDGAYDFVAAAAVGGAALVGTERAMSKIMKTGHMPWWSWAVDGVVHTGIIFYMGSTKMQPTTEKIRTTIENGMKTAGWSDENAKRDAGFATVYIVPNYINWLSNSALAAGMYFGEAKNVWKPDDSLMKNLGEIGQKLGIIGGKQV